MSARCRPFLPDDYHAFAAINNAIYPRHPTTAEDEEAGDRNRPVGKYWMRQTVEDDSGVAVGVAEVRQREAEPVAFEMEIYVHPDWQGRGFGKALYSWALSELTPRSPFLWYVDEVREDLRGVRFLSDRGFTEVMRWWQASLDVAALDLSAYQTILNRSRSQGIMIQTLSEWEASPRHEERLYDLMCDISSHLPGPEPYQRPSFDSFCAELAGRTNKNTYFIAAQDDLYTGVHILVPSYGDDMRIETTGGRSTHRRQGVALALKLRGIEYAKSHGRATLRTMNESGNDPIIALNDRLGFVRQAAWLKMVKTFER